MRNIKIVEILVVLACFSILTLPALNSLIIAPSFTDLLKHVAEKKLIKIAAQMATLIESHQDLTATTDLSPQFLQKIEMDRRLLDLTKIKLFSRSGEIIYSSDSLEIGEFSQKNFFPDLVVRQETRTDIQMVAKDSPGNEVFLVETYVPIIKSGRVIGVFEIYYDMTETRQKLSQVVGTVNWIVLGTSLFLLSAVLICAYLTRRSHILQEKAEAEKDILIKDLSQALSELKTLRGILPLCSYCKKIRDDSGYWEQVDVYIYQHSEADISHSICPDCAAEQFPEIYQEILAEKNNGATTDPPEHN